MTSFDLKCIAIVSMLIDHIGAFLFPGEIWMRYVGRLAFPIYCFLIAEGYFHTKDVHRYMSRLLIFSFISEIPYDLARYNVWFYKDHQNVFFTLLLGLICVYALDNFQELWKHVCVFAFIGLITHFIIKPDYGIGGVILIVCFYLFRQNVFMKYLSVSAINILYYGNIQSFGALALLPIHFYNGKKGPSAKYLFYFFYPVHLVVLYLIRRYFIYVN